MLGTAHGFPICVRGDTPQGYHHLVASRNAELLLKPVKKGEKPFEKLFTLLLCMSKYYPVLEKKKLPVFVLSWDKTALFSRQTKGRLLDP